ncbi:unnamed protein product [Closterium sp. Yama58-4]|nr:unnamed protein product [Closterium sp. Yama58-4]
MYTTSVTPSLSVARKHQYPVTLDYARSFLAASPSRSLSPRNLRPPPFPSFLHCYPPFPSPPLSLLPSRRPPYRPISPPSPFHSPVALPLSAPFPSPSLSSLPSLIALPLSAPFPSPSLSPLPPRRPPSLRALPISFALSPPSLALSLYSPFPSPSLSPPPPNLPSHRPTRRRRARSGTPSPRPSYSRIIHALRTSSSSRSAEMLARRISYFPSHHGPRRPHALLEMPSRHPSSLPSHHSSRRPRALPFRDFALTFLCTRPCFRRPISLVSRHIETLCCFPLVFPTL